MAEYQIKMQRDSHTTRLAAGLLVGYAIQFLAGISLNLFVTLPKVHPGVNAKDYLSGSGHGLLWSLSFQGGIALGIHSYIAVGLLISSFWLVLRSIYSHNKEWKICSAIAAGCTAIAFFSGLRFINYNHDVNSLIMAVAWLVAVGALAAGLRKGRKPSRQLG